MPPLLALLSLLVAVLLGSAPISVVSAPAPLMTSVKSFGTVGDGANDDGPAIQRAMNATGVQNGSGTVYFPAGTYRINAPLVWTCRRLLGESNFASVLRAGQPMSAVLVAPGSHPGSGWEPSDGTQPLSRQNGHEIEQLTVDAHSLADFAVFGASLTRSRFVRSGFLGGRVAGLYIGYGWIHDILECKFAGRGMVGLYVDFASNSINCVDSQFEAVDGELGVGIVVNQGSMVRIEGNTIEGMAGPALIANQINALSVRENYFEGNNRGPSNFSFVDGEGVPQAVCTDILLNGDYGRTATTNSLSLSRFAAAAQSPTHGASSTLFRFDPAPIVLNNHSPCRGVVIEANYMNADCGGGVGMYAGVPYFGAFAAGAAGLRAESNDCSHCAWVHGKPDCCECRVVGTGGGANDNVSLAAFDIKLNTGQFAGPP